MPMPLIDLPLHLYEVRQREGGRHLSRFADDFLESRLAILHSYFKANDDLLRPEWELVAILICSIASNGKPRVSVCALGGNPREILLDIDIHARFHEYHLKCGVPVPNKTPAELEWPLPATKTLGGLLVCRHGTTWDQIGLYPKDLDRTVGYGYHALCLAEIPSCATVIDPTTNEHDSGWLDEAVRKVVGPKFDPPPSPAPKVEASPPAPSVSTAPTGQPNLFFRARTEVKQGGGRPQYQMVFDKAFTDLGRGKFRVWRGEEGDRERLIDPSNEASIVLAFPIIGWETADGYKDGESEMYQNPETLNIIYWAEIWSGFSSLWMKATKGIEIDDDADPELPLTTFVAWIVTVHPDDPDRYDQYILMHPSVQPGVALSQLRGEMRNYFNMDWE